MNWTWFWEGVVIGIIFFAGYAAARILDGYRAAAASPDHLHRDAHRWEMRLTCSVPIYRNGAITILCTFPKLHSGPHGLTTEQAEHVGLTIPPF